MLLRGGAAPRENDTPDANGGFLETLRHIIEDVALVAALLLGLMVITRVADHADLSDDFHKLFMKVHEYVFLFNYLLLAFKGFVRLASMPWRR